MKLRIVMNNIKSYIRYYFVEKHILDEDVKEVYNYVYNLVYESYRNIRFNKV